MAKKSLLAKEMANGYGLTEWRKNGLPNGYFPHWEFNVYGNVMSDRFIRMFNRGSGGELDRKACAVHSSSMLAYNFFHWINGDHPLELTFDSKVLTFSHVFFEIRMIPLGLSTSKKSPANMDVMLMSEDGRDVLMLESKLLEYTENRSYELKMPESYLDEGKYCKSTDVAYWKKVITTFQAKNNGCAAPRYFAGIKQNLCHLIAIDNLIFRDQDALKFLMEENDGLQLNPDANIIYKTLLFKPDEGRFKDESSAYNDYQCLILNNLNSSLPNHKVGMISYSDLWRQARCQMNDDLQAFLEHRYMQFANPS